MSQNYSPDGTYPVFPFVLPIDGEPVTENKLCVSATDGLGWIGKLVNAAGYLRNRSPQVFIITTDGVGGVVATRQTPLDDGATDFFSLVAFNGTDRIRLTFTTGLAAIEDAAFFCGTVGTGDALPQFIGNTTTYAEIGARDISAAALVNLTTSAGVFHLLVFPNLAGMT